MQQQIVPTTAFPQKAWMLQPQKESLKYHRGSQVSSSHCVSLKITVVVWREVLRQKAALSTFEPESVDPPLLSPHSSWIPQCEIMSRAMFSVRERLFSGHCGVFLFLHIKCPVMSLFILTDQFMSDWKLSLELIRENAWEINQNQNND